MTGPALPRGRPLRFSRRALADLIGACLKALPDKSFGLVAGRASGLAEEVLPMQRNLRDESPLVDRFFRSYGPFYRRKDRGFCFDPGELAKVKRRLRRRGLRVIAVYHSHRCRAPRPTRVDMDLHYSPHVYAVLVSVTDPAAPRVRAFVIRGRQAAQVPVGVVGKPR